KGGGQPMYVKVVVFVNDGKVLEIVEHYRLCYILYERSYGN
ncbi:1207_t:CDS:1, partial [Funneliformis caledonium]